MSALAVVGHNNPPPAEVVGGLDTELRAWIKEHPVLQDAAEANKAAQLALRAKKTLDDIEDDRKRRVGPLNAQVKEINAEYAEAATPIQSALVVLRGRMTDYATAEERRRQEEAERLRLEAIERQRAASEAIRDAAEAETNAGFGETVDVVAAKQNAVRLFNESRKADRAFARAEKASEHVHLAPGLDGRAMSLRNREELSVTDAAAAIGATGITEGIAEAILTAARAYKKLKGNYPPGIAVNVTRTV